jgi:glycosyltransferase involved in cell wall biosynthesis
MKVAYLTNQYPKVSHTFIRREIAAVEADGIEVLRLSIRETPDQLADAADIAEQRRTHVILRAGAAGLVLATAATATAHPLRFGKALRMALRLGRRSDRGLLRNLAYLMVASATLRELRKQGCDHVHVHFGTNPAAVALLCRLLGGPPYSFTVHGPEEFDKTWSLSLRDKIENAAFVAGVSSFGRSQLYRHCGHEHWDKIQVVRCGVDESYIECSPSQLPASNQLVCVGRLCEQKGQLLLVEAAARLRDLGEDFRLLLVGDGEMRQEVEALIDRHALRDVIEITGWASGDEVRRHIDASKALVLPSFAEGLPVVIMEALALGRPALTTYIAGIPELVEPNECGWLVPAGSVDALVSALQELLHAQAATLQAMGEEGRRRVLAQHDARRAVQPLLAAFRRGAAP